VTDRKRDPLPADYQYEPWRRPSDNAADRLARAAVVITDNGFTANVIEGESFQSFYDKQAIEAQLADSEPT
jgi:hypothetical protein